MQYADRETRRSGNWKGLPIWRVKKSPFEEDAFCTRRAAIGNNSLNTSLNA
jgi:hypothetical protein